MYTLIRDDVFSRQVDAYVVTVNCVGAMGKGIALSAKEQIPGLFQAYKKVCRSGVITPGSIGEYTYNGKRYLLAATKDHFKDPSKKEWLESIVRQISELAIDRGISSLAMPPLGCQNGWLSFEGDLVPLLDKYLLDHPLRVEVCF